MGVYALSRACSTATHRACPTGSTTCCSTSCAPADPAPGLPLRRVLARHRATRGLRPGQRGVRGPSTHADRLTPHAPPGRRRRPGVARDGDRRRHTPAASTSSRSPARPPPAPAPSTPPIHAPWPQPSRAARPSSTPPAPSRRATPTPTWSGRTSSCRNGWLCWPPHTATGSSTSARPPSTARARDRPSPRGRGREPAPVSRYGRTKLAGTEAVLAQRAAAPRPSSPGSSTWWTATCRPPTRCTTWSRRSTPATGRCRPRPRGRRRRPRHGAGPGAAPLVADALVALAVARGAPRRRRERVHRRRHLLRRARRRPRAPGRARRHRP